MEIRGERCAVAWIGRHTGAENVNDDTWVVFRTIDGSSRGCASRLDIVVQIHAIAS